MVCSKARVFHHMHQLHPLLPVQYQRNSEHDSVLKVEPADFRTTHIKGWGLYKQGRQQEALGLLQKSWDLRMEYAVYDRTAFIHLEEVKKAGTSSR
jgi:hypothetical protein